MRASDGALLGTRKVGLVDRELAFDGINVWVANGGDNTVMMLRGTHGAIKHIYGVDTYPVTVLFDGTSIWVANYYANTVNKISRNVR